MEKTYIFLNSLEGQKKTGYTDAEFVYVFDNLFKEHLFNTLVKQNMTDISDGDIFNDNIEIYKVLKQFGYFNCDSVKIVLQNREEISLSKREAILAAEKYEKKVRDIKNILEIVKKEIEEEKKEKKIVVYTCITGGYDNLMEPTVITPGVDYICFTDNMSMKSKTWKLRPIPEELKNYSNVKRQRGVKILAHRYLSEYDISVWVDGAVKVQGNIKDYLKTLDFSQYSVFIPEHPVRKCIYVEKDACVRIRKIKGDEITLAEKQMKRYKEENFPTNYGLVQTNVMIRTHNDQFSKDLMEKWWDELKDYSHRDQLSFNYALWKVGSEKFKYLIKTTCNSKTFNWLKGHNKR